jgi:two-component system, chemotaxis family, chemotaxis protein CheY
MGNGGRKHKILVLDDNLVCLEVAAATLEDAGYQVISVSKPLGLYSVLEREKPDLVVVDLSMPALDGDQVVSILRRTVRYSCPVVLYSGCGREELAARAAACGATEYVTKSDDHRPLLACVRRLLGRERLRP